MTQRAVSRPHPLYGSHARAGESRSVGDGLPTTAQSDDASMYGLIGGAATGFVSARFMDSPSRQGSASCSGGLQQAGAIVGAKRD